MGISGERASLERGRWMVGLLLLIAGWPSELMGSEPAAEQNFRIRTFRGGPSAQAVSAECAQLMESWLAEWPGSQTPRWEPPCEIVIYPNRNAYLAVVGRGAASTSGSSLVKRRRDGTLERRIDLLVGADGRLSALPHELVHVLLADHFGGELPPLWLDEGLAMWRDTPEKQRKHWRDCEAAWRNGSHVPLAQLFELDSVPGPTRFAAVYGQSLTLTRFLATQDEPQQILELAFRGEKIGYRRAVTEVYGLAWEDLEQRWREFVRRESEGIALTAAQAESGGAVVIGSR